MMDKRSFFFNRQTMDGSPFFQGEFFTPPEDYEDPQALVSHLREHGIDYLLVGLSRRDPDRMEQYERRMDGLVAGIARAREEGLLRVEWSGAPYLLLAVSPSSD